MFTRTAPDGVLDHVIVAGIAGTHARLRENPPSCVRAKQAQNQNLLMCDPSHTAFKATPLSFVAPSERLRTEDFPGSVGLWLTPATATTPGKEKAMRGGLIATLQAVLVIAAISSLSESASARTCGCECYSSAASQGPERLSIDLDSRYPCSAANGRYCSVRNVNSWDAGSLRNAAPLSGNTRNCSG